MAASGRKIAAAAIAITTGAKQTVKSLGIPGLWLLMLATVASVSGCVIQHHPDGGITIRPIHVG